MKTAPPPISASVEDYLTAIYRLTPSGTPVGPTRLADFMGLSAPSVTIMMRRLSEQGLVVKDSGRGLALSPDGVTRALEVLRKHRLSECFLVDKLGFDWANAYVEAHRFEHALSPLVTEALDRFLGHPRTCPHGNPIPDAQGGVWTEPSVPLPTLQPEDRAVVRRVDEDSLEVLAWLHGVGLIPQAPITVEAIDPSGSILLETSGRQVAIGTDVARYVHVARIEAIETGGSPA